MRTLTATLLGVSLTCFAASFYFETAVGVVAFAAASILCWMMLDN